MWSSESLLVVLLVSCTRHHIISSTSIVPSNPIGVVGQTTMLKCPVYENRNLYQNYGSQYHPKWTIENLSNHETCNIDAAGSTTGRGCHRRSYSVQFVPENLNGFQRVSTLSIVATNLSDAGTYTCTFYNQNNQPQTTRTVLSVLASAPIGEVSRSHVTYGDNVTYTCRVSYASSSVLKMSWTDTETGETVSPPGGRVSTDDSHSSLISLESSLTITVPSGVRVVQPYTCNVTALPMSSTQSNGVQQWNSTAITISYCPKNIAVTASHDDLIEGLQLTCQSEALPPAVYRWVVFGGRGTVSGSDNSTLTVTSLTSDEVIEFRCTAVNFLQGDNQKPCYASASITFCNGQVDETSSSQTVLSSTELPQLNIIVNTTLDTSSVVYSRTSIDPRSSTSGRTDVSRSPRQTVLVTLTRDSSAAVTSVISTNSIATRVTNKTTFIEQSTSRTSSRPTSDVTTRLAPPTWSSVQRGTFLITAIASSADKETSAESSKNGHQTALVVLSVLMSVVIATVAAISIVLVRVVRQLRNQRDFTMQRLDRTSASLKSNVSVSTEMTSLTANCHPDS